MANPLPLLVFLSFMSLSFCSTNQSICTDITLNDLHFYINQQEDNADLSYTQGTQVITYNLCQQVEIYCPYQNSILQQSMVIVDASQQTCIFLQQTNVDYLDGVKANSGIVVTYYSLVNNRTININYPCNLDTGLYCPTVQSGIIFEYFNKSVITYTIILQIIGVILMVLGIYVYRGSIVLIGWGTALVILLFIESFFIFVRGIPNATINLVLALTIITAFFVGYILGYFPKAGLFCMGMWIGIIITFTLNNVCLYFINSNPQNLSLYIVMPILAIGFGVLILFIKRTFIIFASSLIGAYFCLRALSWSLGGFPNQFLLSKQYHYGLAPPVPWQFYLYVIALLILTASASALQVWLFKKKMRKNKESTNLQDHFNEMESSMNKQKERMFEIRDVFKSEEMDPKVLKKPRNTERRKHVRDDDSVEQKDLRRKNQRQDSLPPDYDSEQEGSGSEEYEGGRPELREKLLARNAVDNITRR